jgi:parvulin-like peptidyl-prolyl isomerase
MKASRWFKEPFLHFLIGGGVLFAAYAWLNPTAPDPGPGLRPIRIGAGEVRWLTETWARQWHREPTPEELRGLVSNLLKEELLAREARELRLDENDTIVRRRLAQKLEFLLQDTARLAEPTEEELRRIYEATPDAYLTESRVSFVQIYFSRERRKDAVKDATEALARLARVPSADIADVGDRLLVEGEFRDVDRQTVANAFGPQFARAVFALRPGAWHGPLESGYGVHLVRVAAAEPGQQRSFADVRSQLLERWREQRQRESEARFFTRLMEKYEVVVDESVKSIIGSLTMTKGTR